MWRHQLLSEGADVHRLFDESVQGLQGDSIVKYRGVDVGAWKDPGGPDNKLIGVVIKVNLRDKLAANTMAQLKAAGITASCSSNWTTANRRAGPLPQDKLPSNIP